MCRPLLLYLLPNARIIAFPRFDRTLLSPCSASPFLPVDLDAKRTPAAGRGSYLISQSSFSHWTSTITPPLISTYSLLRM